MKVATTERRLCYNISGSQSCPLSLVQSNFPLEKGARGFLSPPCPIEFPPGCKATYLFEAFGMERLSRTEKKSSKTPSPPFSRGKFIWTTGEGKNSAWGATYRKLHKTIINFENELRHAWFRCLDFRITGIVPG